MIYLDNAASAPMHTDAIKEMQRSMLLDFSNPSAKHKLAEESYGKVQHVRDVILEKLNANNKYDLIFTSSATESNNIAINSIPTDANIAYSKAMHPSLLLPLLNRQYSSTQQLPLSTVIESAEAFLPATKNTHLVVSHVNSLTGHIANIKKLTENLKKDDPNNSIHVDAAQSFGKLFIDLNDSNIDTLTINSNKMGGPKGIAALIFKKGYNLKPVFQGGYHEFGLRPGTLNTPAIVGWGKAVELTFNDLNKSFEKTLALKTKLMNKLKEDFHGINIPKEHWHTSPYILLITIDAVPSDVLLRLLQDKDVIVSSSTACSSKSKKPIFTFDEIGLAKNIQKSALRISFSHKTTAYEMDAFCDALNEQLKFVQKIDR